MKGGLLLHRSRQVPAEDTAAFGGIAERFRRAGDLDRAIALCRDGLQKFPTLLSARVTLGWALLDKGDYDEARAELEQVLRRAPDNLAAIRGLAELHDRTDHLSDGRAGWQHEQEEVASLDDSASETPASIIDADLGPSAEHAVTAAPQYDVASIDHAGILPDPSIVSHLVIDNATTLEPEGSAAAPIELDMTPPAPAAFLATDPAPTAAIDWGAAEVEIEAEVEARDHTMSSDDVVNLPASGDVGFEELASAFSSLNPDDTHDVLLEAPTVETATPDVILPELSASSFEDRLLTAEDSTLDLIMPALTSEAAPAVLNVEVAPADDPTLTLDEPTLAFKELVLSFVEPTPALEDQTVGLEELVLSVEEPVVALEASRPAFREQALALEELVPAYEEPAPALEEVPSTPGGQAIALEELGPVFELTPVSEVPAFEASAFAGIVEEATSPLGLVDDLSSQPVLDFDQWQPSAPEIEAPSLIELEDSTLAESTRVPAMLPRAPERHPALGPLERLLRQVKARRLDLHSGSVA